MKAETDREATPPQTHACAACGERVSSTVPGCPHCGHPQKTADRSRVGGGAGPFKPTRIFKILACIGAVAVFTKVAERKGSLPQCDSSNAQSDVQNAWASAPMGKLLGLAVIDFSDVRTVSASGAEVKCHSTVMLNNATTHSMTYSFKDRGGGQYLIEARLDDF